MSRAETKEVVREANYIRRLDRRPVSGGPEPTPPVRTAVTAVADAGRSLRGDQVGATRYQILTTAERLFAEQGLYAVSNRQISAAAGQGNNAAVGYHFGTKADLMRAIVRRHGVRIEVLRATAVAAVSGSRDVRDWVTCLVKPMTDYVMSFDGPTWFSRFSAQTMTDPAFQAVVTEDAMAGPSLREILDSLYQCLPDMPADVRVDRINMIRHLLVHVFAERERALSEDDPTPTATWDEAAIGLIDAITGLWTAPYTCEQSHDGPVSD